MMSHFASSKRKFVLVVLLFLSGIAVLIPHFYNWNEQRHFISSWREDFSKLLSSNEGHPGLKEIKSVKLIATDSDLENLYHQAAIDFKESPQGKYVLEIFMDHVEEDGGVVIQYDLVDLSSGNTIWENGQTYSQKVKL